MGIIQLMFSIIIPTFNNVKYLKLCISSIKKNSIFKHEIIPHINKGTDGTEDYLISENIKLILIFNKVSLTNKWI